MVTTNPKTARGIFYKLAKEFEEMDRRNKIPIRQIENARISKLKFETEQTIIAISERKPSGATNDKKTVIPRLRRFKDLEENR